MAHKVYFRPRAELRLTELYDYIAAQSSADIAYKYVEGIRETCTNLTTFPERGTKRDDIMPGLRTIGFRRRVTIAFRILKTRVEIVSIAYGGRNFERELREGK